MVTRCATLGVAGCSSPTMSACTSPAPCHLTRDSGGGPAHRRSCLQNKNFFHIKATTEDGGLRCMGQGCHADSRCTGEDEQPIAPLSSLFRMRVHTFRIYSSLRLCRELIQTVLLSSSTLTAIAYSFVLMGYFG